MPHYHIWTIGCQMNKAESERLGSLLEQRGYRSTAEPEKADLIILNTCVVRESAENRVINKLHLLRRLKQQRPELQIAVTGCFVSPDQNALTGKVEASCLQIGCSKNTQAFSAQPRPMAMAAIFQSIRGVDSQRLSR